MRFYYEKHPAPYWLLYEALLSTDTGLAAFFVNNTYICVLYPDGLRYTDMKDGSTETYLFKEGEFKYHEMMDVGFVKTYMTCAQFSHLPFRLQMDLETGDLYVGNGRWVKPEGFPLEQKEIAYKDYKDLLEQPNAIAVYYDTILDKRVYIQEDKNK